MSHRSLIRTLVQPIAIAVLLAFVLRLVIQIDSIPSASMAPTLLAGDRILVTRYLRSDPRPGHIVVFVSPADPDETVVKRVVAVAGDLVASRSGRLTIGGQTVPEPYVAEAAATGEISPLIVPADSYFVLGDNRRDSIDSRSWGVVPRSAIEGRARMILWSSADARPGAKPRPLESSRGPRLFKWID